MGDYAALAWNGKVIETTASRSQEMYIGPAMMVFHIPFAPLGAFNALVTTTPVEGGSVMRVRTFVSATSWLGRLVAWLLIGVSAAHLQSDIDILVHRIRPHAPTYITKGCGPYALVMRWVKQ